MASFRVDISQEELDHHTTAGDIAGALKLAYHVEEDVPTIDTIVKLYTAQGVLVPDSMACSEISIGAFAMIVQTPHVSADVQRRSGGGERTGSLERIPVNLDSSPFSLSPSSSGQPSSEMVNQMMVPNGVNLSAMNGPQNRNLPTSIAGAPTQNGPRMGHRINAAAMDAAAAMMRMGGTRMTNMNELKDGQLPPMYSLESVNWSNTHYKAQKLDPNPNTKPLGKF